VEIISSFREEWKFCIRSWQAFPQLCCLAGQYVSSICTVKSGYGFSSVGPFNWINVFVHFCLIEDSSCSSIWGLLSLIFCLCCTKCFQMWKWWKGLDCRRASPTPGFLLWGHAVAVCSFALACWFMQGLPWNILMWMVAYVVLKPLQTAFRIDGAFGCRH